MFTHLNQIIRKTIFLFLGGPAPPNFLQTLDNDQILLAHFLSETGAFLQLFSKGSQKLA